jgi:exonuclease III
MKIVTWNCNGAFRKKYHLIDELNADILVIQECENPNESTKEYKNWTNDNYLWIGDNKNKGLGIFVRKNNSIELVNWSDININYKNEKLESFLPCKINDSFILLAVWTKHANSEVFGYIGQFWKYLQLHKNKISKDNIIIVGDFNSNSIWDKWDRWWNHSDVVNELEEIKIKSLYHTLNNEEQGKEITPTFYLQRNIKKAYHVDYRKRKMA